MSRGERAHTELPDAGRPYWETVRWEEDRTLTDPSVLEIDTDLITSWLVAFLQDEIWKRRGFRRVVVGLSGGVDSAVSAALCAKAFGPKSVTALMLPYKTSDPCSLEHALMVADQLGIRADTIEITQAVEGYVREAGSGISAHRLGNLASRVRMAIIFDQAYKLNAMPVGTGNKSERLLGYFTWHGDDAPPVNPLGDLFKTQVWALARALELPEEVIAKPPTADLIPGQTDEVDLGIGYAEADMILHHLLSGWTRPALVEGGFCPRAVETVTQRLNATHWKRHLPTVAMLSETAIGEAYLRTKDA